MSTLRIMLFKTPENRLDVLPETRTPKTCAHGIIRKDHVGTPQS